MSESTFDTLVVCIEPHLGKLKSGEEYVCRLGSLYPTDCEQVRRNPPYFAPADGRPLVRYERPDPREDPPPPPPKPRPRMLRSRKDWRSDLIEMPNGFGGIERIRITLHEGKVIPETTGWLPALTARQRRDLFEPLP